MSRESAQKYRDVMKAKGLCVECSKEKTGKYTDRYRCKECSIGHAAYMKSRRTR